MFGIRKSFAALRPSAPAPRKSAVRTRLGCEQLPDRVNPTTTGTFAAGFATNGTFTYDESQIDPNQPSQTLTLHDFGFDVGGSLHYTADTDPVANLAYGDFVSVHGIEMSPNIAGPPHLTIDVDGTTATVVQNHNPASMQTYNPVALAIKTSITLDFSTIKTGVKYTLSIEINELPQGSWTRG